MMKIFKKDLRAAVTVFVTLLIIPAMLITGTAVDITRIYTARSIVQSAHQTALNSALTQYNAMLKDIYGLFGVLEDPEYGSEELTKLVQGHLNQSLGVETTKGLFSKKSNGQDFGAVAIDSQPKFTISPVLNLGDENVFRRQVAEYAKIRGPVVIVERIINGVEALKKIADDMKTVSSKVKLDNSLKDAMIKANRLYVSIKSTDFDFKILKQRIDKHSWKDGGSGSTGSVKDFVKGLGHLEELNDKLINLSIQIKNKEKEISTCSDDETRKTLEEELEELKKIFSKEEKGFDSQKSTLETKIKTIEEEIGTVVEASINHLYKFGASSGKAEFSAYKSSNGSIKRDCEELQKAVDELKSKKNDYEKDLKKSSQDLKDSLTGDSQKDYNELYEKLIDTRPKEMGYEHIYSYKNSPVNKSNKECLDNIAIQLKKVFAIQVPGKSLPGNDDSDGSMAKTSFTNAKEEAEKIKDYFKIIEEHNVLTDFQNTGSGHKEYYDFLEKKFGDANELKKADDIEKEADGKVKELNDEMKKKMESVEINPMGAKHVPNHVQGSKGDKDFMKGLDNRDNALKNVLDKQKKNLEKPSFLNGITEDLLLYSYDMTMFSSYNTICDGENNVKNMNQIPMTKDVNYLMHWEKEYLCMGDATAEGNILKIMGIIGGIRLVLNYIASFGIITPEIAKIAAPAGPLQPVVQEILRFAYTIGETAIDCYKLMPKHQADGSLSESGQSEKVPLIKKTNAEWTFSIKGAVSKMIEASVKKKSNNELENNSKDKRKLGLDYDGYVDIILFFNLNKLCSRTQKLVTYNINNKLQKAQAKENMEIKWELKAFSTDFELSSEVQVRTMFMPIFNSGSLGLPTPVRNYTINRKDYRGY